MVFVTFGLYYSHPAGDLFINFGLTRHQVDDAANITSL